MNSLIQQTFPLFRPPFVLFFFVCSFLNFGTFAVSGGMAMFLPDILNKLSSSKDLKICEMIKIQAPTNNSTGEILVSSQKLESFRIALFYRYKPRPLTKPLPITKFVF